MKNGAKLHLSVKVLRSSEVSAAGAVAARVESPLLLLAGGRRCVVQGEKMSERESETISRTQHIVHYCCLLLLHPLSSTPPPPTSFGSLADERHS